MGAVSGIMKRMDVTEDEARVTGTKWRKPQQKIQL